METKQKRSFKSFLLDFLKGISLGVSAAFAGGLIHENALDGVLLAVGVNAYQIVVNHIQVLNLV